MRDKYSMSHYLRPHSNEWFAALEKFDQHQAEHTRQIIRLAGSSEVCSVCGDKPASDYQILKASVPKDSVPTIRLCDDCRDVRQALHGEDFIPFSEGAGPDRRN